MKNLKHEPRIERNFIIIIHVQNALSSFSTIALSILLLGGSEKKPTTALIKLDERIFCILIHYEFLASFVRRNTFFQHCVTATTHPHEKIIPLCLRRKRVLLNKKRSYKIRPWIFFRRKPRQWVFSCIITRIIRDMYCYVTNYPSLIPIILCIRPMVRQLRFRLYRKCINFDGLNILRFEYTNRFVLVQ